MMTTAFIFAPGLLLAACFCLYLSLIRLKQVSEDNIALEADNERLRRDLAAINHDLDRIFKPYPRR